MVDYNPRRPDVLGVEFAPGVGARYSVTASPGLGVEVRASATEDVEAIWLHVRNRSTNIGNITDSVPIAVDVYDADPNMDGKLSGWQRGDLVHAVYTVNADAPDNDPQWTVGTLAGSPSDVPGDPAEFALYSKVNEYPWNVIYTDWVEYASAGSLSHRVRFRLRTNGLDEDVAAHPAVSLTGKRVANVQLRVLVSNESPRYAAALSGHLAMDVRGVGRLSEIPIGDRLTVAPGGEPEWLTFDAPVNPATRLPWCLADVQRFTELPDSTWYVGLRATTGPTTDPLRVYTVCVDVTVCDDRRVATAQEVVPGGGEQARWVEFPMRRVTDCALTPWTKASNRLYWLVVYRGADTSPAAMSVLEGDAVDSAPGTKAWGLRYVALKPTSSGVTEVGDIPPDRVENRVPAAVLVTTGGALSVDSQPYVYVRTSEVAAGQNVEQEFTPTASGTYAFINCWLAGDGIGEPWANPPHLPDTALEVRVFRRSDGVQFGGVGTIDADTDVEGTRAVRLVRCRLSSNASLVAGTQYVLRFSSATATTRPWLIAALDSHSDDFAAATYGGTTDVLTVGAVDYQRRDAVVTFGSVPTAPGSVTATTPIAAVTGGCGIDGVRYARVTWAATTLGSKFARYEVSRSEDGGTSWRHVASITPEALPEFSDYEARRGVALRYRIRVVRTDGIRSDWSSTTAPVTLVAGAELVIGSNTLGGVWAWHYDGAEAVSWEPVPAAAVEYHARYGTPYQVEVRDSTERGVTFTRSLVVAYNDPSLTGGWAEFDDLRNLLASDAPYLAVCDGRGNRWLCGGYVSRYTEEQPGDRLYAEVVFTEVLGAPPAVTLINAP